MTNPLILYFIFYFYIFFLAHNCLIGAWTSSFYADREMPSVMKLSTHQRENDPQQPLPSGTLCLLNVFCLFLLTMDHVGICSNNLTLEPVHSAFCTMLSTQHGSHSFGFSSEPQSFPVPAPAQQRCDISRDKNSVLQWRRCRRVFSPAYRFGGA